MVDYVRRVLEFMRLASARDAISREHGVFIGTFKIEKYADERCMTLHRPYAVSVFHNSVVNLGCQELWKLATAQPGAVAYSNANAAIGVGDGNAPVLPTQFNLQGANKTFVPMDAGYPSAPVNGLERWRATFGPGDANYAWEEFGVFNSTAPGVMLNRALSSEGTKVLGQTWTVTASITIS